MMHRNLLALQRLAALKKLDEQITEDHAAGYGVDVDKALERRYTIKEQMEKE